MRAGCFAEDRVIDLMNLRFVSYFFNRGGPGQGHNGAASAFVDGQTKNPYAYFAAFSPDGKLLGETELYADKDAAFDFLGKLLREHPEFEGPNPTKAEWNAAGSGEDRELLRAKLFEDLGRYDQARALYAGVLKQTPPGLKARALSGLLRITRYQKNWQAHAKYLGTLQEQPGPRNTFDVQMERGYSLLAKKEYGTARTLLQTLARTPADNPRLAEAHFYAGVACWFLEDRDWAKFHWVFIVENLAEDRLYSRARIAAAAEGMPYPNPELANYEGPVGNIGPHNIVSAVQAATEIYRQLLPAFEAGDLQMIRKPQASSDIDANDPAALVAALRDGNAFVAENNKIVERLQALGSASVAPLMESLANPKSLGQGYSGWALAVVLQDMDSKPVEALALLEKAASQDPNDYVRLLSRSGLNQLPAEPLPPAGDQEKIEHKSPLLLVAALRDGNRFRVANNRLVERLQTLGKPAIAVLIIAVQDEHFPGRGYAAWALASVLKSNKLEHAQALAALNSATQSSNSYVSTLARSGLSHLME